MATAASRTPSTSRTRFTASSAKPVTTCVSRPARRRDRQRIRKYGAAVPIGVPVRAALVLPRVPPEYTRVDNRHGRRCHLGVARRRGQQAPLDSRPTALDVARCLAPRIGRRPAGQARQVAAHQVQLDVVQRAGARRRARKAIWPLGTFSHLVMPAESLSSAATSSSVGAPPRVGASPEIASSAGTSEGADSSGSGTVSALPVELVQPRQVGEVERDIACSHTFHGVVGLADGSPVPLGRSRQRSCRPPRQG